MTRRLLLWQFVGVMTTLVSLCDCPGQRWRYMAACVSICLYTFKKWNISFGSVSEAVSQLRLREAGGKLLG